MKYNIISINDQRAEYKARIRERVGLEEVSIPAVNGYEVDIEQELEKRGLTVARGRFSHGEVGIWLSVFDCWQWAVDNDEPLVVFEDDAIPAPDFNTRLWEFRQELPSDYDFLTLWVPENQYNDYIYHVRYNEDGTMEHIGPNRNVITSLYNIGAIRLVRAYNGYGNVAMLYSPKGAKFFIDEARKGITSPVDCFIYLQSHLRKCKGYAPKPNRAKIVGYDWQAETTVHGVDRV